MTLLSIESSLTGRLCCLPEVLGTLVGAAAVQGEATAAAEIFIGRGPADVSPL